MYIPLWKYPNRLWERKFGMTKYSPRSFAVHFPNVKELFRSKNSYIFETKLYFFIFFEKNISLLYYFHS